MNRIAIAMLLALGCAGADETELATAPARDPQAQEPQIPVGVGEVNGLLGTPLEVSPRGMPIIEGVERPDYSEEGINSFDKRMARRTDTNPTGEYRFPWHDAEPTEWIADADDRAGFRNGLEEYTWRLTHPNVLHEKANFVSAVFHGRAFTTDGNGGILALGACWLPQNAGKDCEFPNSKNKVWRWRSGSAPQDSFSFCNQTPPSGSMAPPFYADPLTWAQIGFDLWRPEAVMTETATATEKITVWCPQSLPGSVFGGVMGASGGDGPTPRRVTNAADAPGGTLCSGSSFPKGLYTYDAGNIQYSGDNLYQRALLCTTAAERDNDQLFQIASINMFAHEMGHFLGFAHFSTGIMQTGGDCSLFYHQQRTLPQSFHDALAKFSPNSGTYKFIPGGCNGFILPTPTADNGQFPIGRLQQ
jgi:hypothetical protein